jgi:hypothetical protein
MGGCCECRVRILESKRDVETDARCDMCMRERERKMRKKKEVKGGGEARAQRE